MKQRRIQRGAAVRVAVMLVASALLHLALGVTVLPELIDDYEPLPPTEEAESRPFEVSVVSSDELEKVLQEEEPEPLTPPEPEVELEKQPEPDQEKKPEILPEERRVVQQVTNQERPEEANFVSQQDNRTAEETRARETTTAEVIPSNEANDTERAQLARAKVERIEPEHRRKRQRTPLADPSEIVRKRTEVVEESEFGERQDDQRRKLFAVADDDFAEVIGHEYDEAAHESMQEKRLLAGWEDEERIMRGALENFITDVKPGNHTSVNSHGRAWANYLGRIHRKIHVRWASGYLADLDLREPAGSPLNDPTLNTKLEFVIRARDGVVERINIVRTSGELRFDAEAIMISKAVGPHPGPPPELVSPNGRVYVHWNFWRNQRQCGVFGASVFIVEKDAG